MSLDVTSYSEFGQRTIVDLQSLQSFVFWPVACNRARRGVHYGAGLATVHGGTMKTLSDVAASYEECAQANEATAEQIFACLDSFAAQIRDTQRWRAGWLTADAAQLRFRAAELRTVERRINELGLIVSSGKSAEN